MFRRGIFLGETITGTFRPDLLQAGMGDGRHGFIFHLPDDVRHEEADLAAFCVFAGARDGTGCPSPLGAAGPTSKALPRDAGRFFKPYLAALRETPVHEDETQIVDYREIADTLCARDLDAPMSAFAAHIARKYAHSPALERHPQAFWQWYIGNYGVEQGPRRAPLSRDDLDHVKRSGLIGPCLAEASVAAAVLASRYDWAIEESARLFVEDRLVSNEDAEMLRAVTSRRTASRFPLSNFMMLLRQRHEVLRGVPTHHEEGRRRLYALAILLALRSPHYLAYMPRDWLLRLFAPRVPKSLFEQTLGDLFGSAHALGAARCLRFLEAGGYDVGSATFVGTTYRHHRVLGGARTVARAPHADAPLFDVQMIGPFGGRLGLGESCRRFAEAFRRLPFSTNFVDYRIGGGDIRDIPIPTGQPKTARINILHLNAEEIPEACAYLPDVFSRSRMIAVPYWELDAPARAHRLGLDLVDEIWAASRFLASVFGAGVSPVRWTGLSYEGLGRADKSMQRRRYGLNPETFVFITTSDALSWFQRKNPHGVIDAFQRAFSSGENVALVVKTRNVASAPASTRADAWREIAARGADDPRIKLIEGALADGDHRALLAASDCLVSLHRAEGLGLDLLDAMGAGVPVVATAYSGNMDFCSDDTAWLVDADLRLVQPRDYCFVEPGHRWAEPRLCSAVAALKGVYQDCQRRIDRAAAGRAFVRRNASPDVFAERIGRLVVDALSTP